MERLERLNLIRAKASRAPAPVLQPKGLFRAANPDAPKEYRRKFTLMRNIKKHASGWQSGIYGPPQYEEERRTKWIQEPDQIEAHCETKRRRGQHYLEAIAEKVPGKLPAIPQSLGSKVSVYQASFHAGQANQHRPKSP